ncbi:hypothetical protein HPP92_000841 [Vanilla planifolia]|uniref:Alkyl transferase n=1 Tax=Vanilla planifolia TaxID=51239 RepID=A0A835VGH7_VANPL|nr:hypothetical protein HPP92_000841 [Vanilla planifolia]
MDGNRRYAKKRSMEHGSGHRFGYASLISLLSYCYDIGVHHVTIYVFSIDNFRRKPEEVQSTMDLIKDKIDELVDKPSIVKDLGIRIDFCGNLNLLTDAVRLSVEKATRITSGNTGRLVLHLCVAYTSTDEITRAVQTSCREKRNGMRVDGPKEDSVISVADLERHLYGVGCGDPDLLIRTSGETRLSNFLLWQTSFSLLLNPKPLWPEFSVWHFMAAIVEYQRSFRYLQQKRSSAAKRS